MSLLISGDLRLAKGYSLPDDADAVAYIAAVEAADGQALETATRMAINSFVKGCKNDGIWPAIKASCILAGARTLAGALVPLVGTAPTNVNFVAADYNRETGLVGDGSTKYLNANRANNADPQDNNHNAVWLHSVGSNERAYMGTETASNGWNLIYNQGASGNFRIFVRNRSTIGVGGTNSSPLGPVPTLQKLVGANRPSANDVVVRAGASSVNIGSYPSMSAVNSSSLLIFRRDNGAYTDARLAFYSIGESLDLALLDTRVTDLINAFGAAIP